MIAVFAPTVVPVLPVVGVVLPVALVVVLASVLAVAPVLARQVEMPVQQLGLFERGHAEVRELGLVQAPVMVPARA